MTSKEKILNSIRENNIVKDVKLPSYENFGIKFDNKFETFSTMLESVGGKALVIEKEDLDKTIKELYPDEKIIASNVDFCSLGNFDSNSQDDTHNLKDIDLAIVKGNFAVAENGAIWMKDESNRHRSLYFIAQNIVIVINENEIVVLVNQSGHYALVKIIDIKDNSRSDDRDEITIEWVINPDKQIDFS